MYDVETYDHAGVPVRIVWDEDGRNPYTEWDNASEILSDVKDDDLGGDVPHPESAYADTPSSVVMARWLTLFGGYAVAVPWTFQDYGSSGSRTWLTTPDDDPADGWLVMSRETFEREGFESIEQAEKCARGEFESFRAWIEQEVYGFIVAEGSEDEASCWGFYGSLDRHGRDVPYVMQDANSVAEYIAAERARTRALPWLPTFGRPIQKGGIR